MSAPIPVSEGFISFRGYRTWYRIVGNLAQVPAGQFPVLMLHGGPGLPHDSLEPLEALAETGRPVVFYDQLGCGNSDWPHDPLIWSVDLFLEELATIRQELQLDRLHLFGHSWGGMLAMAYALAQPTGLRSLILASAIASWPLCEAERTRFCNQHLSPQFREILEKHEAAGTLYDPTYQEARKIFDQQYCCRIDPRPEFLQRAIRQMNFKLNQMMWMPSEVREKGILSNWDMRSRLSEIQIPTLITSGRYDGYAPGQEQILQESIPNSEWVSFEASSHYPHVEESESYLAALNNFLTRIESKTHVGWVEQSETQH